MYEPYPYQINKVKIFSLTIIALLLLGGFVFFRLSNISLSSADQPISILQYLGYLLLFAILFFCLKAYLLKYSRDYLYIAVGAFLVLLFQLFKRFWNFEASNLNYLAKIDFEPIILGTVLLLSSFNAGKTISIKKRNLNLILIPLLLIISTIFAFWFLVYFVIPFYNMAHLQWAVKILSLVILLWTAIKFVKLYDKKGQNIYFWFITAVLFLIFSTIYLPFDKQTNDVLLLVADICLLVAFFSLVIITFEEHTRFMDSEIDVRKSLEKSLLQVERNLETYRNLVNEVDVGIFVIDEEGHVTFSNDRLGRIFGIPKEQLIGRSQTTLFDEANLEKFLIEREKWITGLKSQFEIELLNPKGKNIPVLIIAVPIKDRWQRYRGSRNVVIEISAWKEFEKKLKEYSTDLEKKIQQRTEDLNKQSEEWKREKKYYETLISGMLDILLVVDKQGNCIFINDYGKKLLGYAAAELNNKKLPNFFADMEKLQKNYGDSMKIELRDYEAELKTKSGQKILCSWNVRYLFDHTGKHIGAMCVGRDISEYKAMQEKLKEHSKNLEKLVAQRTKELNLKVNELAKILKVGEDIILNINLSDILFNICKAIQSMGWKIVIIAQKQEDESISKISTFVGIERTKINKFLSQREYLFKDTLKYLRDECRIGHSYLVESLASAGSNFIPQGIKDTNNTKQSWHEGDVLLCPIKIKNRILGFIMVFNPSDGLRPNEEKTQILEIFAQKAAVAIENNHLFKEIKSRAKELETANKLKSEFFTNMSHELRTPLNSILTLTTILLKKMTGELNSEQLRQIRIIKRNGERLLKLINDILDLSKIEAGKMEVNYSYFPIIDIIRANMDTIRPLCDRKRLRLELKVNKNVPKYIFSDKEKIDHVLTNILSNGVKFTNKGKISISVNTSNKGKSLDININDTGIGIDEEELEYVFQPFRQSGNHKNKGTGLGLSISKQLWQMLEGNISVKSIKGKGTQFHLQLPLKKVTERKQDTSSTDDIQKSSSEKISPMSLNEHKKILLVDDNQDNRYALKFILEDKGYHVLFARNGKDGINKAIKEKPSLILMDMMMPGIDGYQATKAIRAKKKLKGIPIIAMTAKTKQEDKGKALKAGCSDYISKPFTLDDVVSKVHQWIKDSK